MRILWTCEYCRCDNNRPGDSDDLHCTQCGAPARNTRTIGDAPQRSWSGFGSTCARSDATLQNYYNTPLVNPF